MNIIDASVILIAALFGFYGLTSAVEYGIIYKILAKDQSVKSMFTPLWEVTNVFLVFGFTALAILFNQSLSAMSHLLLPTLAVAIVLMLVRACTVLYIFYIKLHEPAQQWLVWLFAATTLAVPLCFSSAGIYMLSGDYFWHSLLGVLLMMSTFVGLSATGLLIIDRKASGLSKLPGEMLFALWMLLLGCALPLTVLHKQNYLNAGPLLVLSLLAGAGLLVGLADYIRKMFIATWHVSAVLSLLVPVLLAWSLRPYLVAGRIGLNAAYGAQTYGSAVVIGLAVMLPLIIFGLWQFGRLLGTPVKPK